MAMPLFLGGWGLLDTIWPPKLLFNDELYIILTRMNLEVCEHSVKLGFPKFKNIVVQ